MRYWDTSALVPLLVEEEGTDLVQAWLREDASVATWALTRLELNSAIERRFREGALTAVQRRDLLARCERFAATWGEVADVLAVRARAQPMLARNDLRAADAAQLGAASLLADGLVQSLEVVCLDRRLAAAADREGFRVLSWP